MSPPTNSKTWTQKEIETIARDVSRREAGAIVRDRRQFLQADWNQYVFEGKIGFTSHNGTTTVCITSEGRPVDLVNFLAGCFREGDEMSIAIRGKEWEPPQPNETYRNAHPEVQVSVVYDPPVVDVAPPVETLKAPKSTRAPKEKQRIVLELLEKAGGSMRPRAVYDEMVKMGALGEVEINQVAKVMGLVNVIVPIWVEKHGQRGGTVLKITDEGRQALKLGSG